MHVILLQQLKSYKFRKCSFRFKTYFFGKTLVSNLYFIAVYSSAGVGRTGCFILIDSMLEKANKDGTIDIYNYLQYLRTRRINMVQTEVYLLLLQTSI